MWKKFSPLDSKFLRQLFPVISDPMADYRRVQRRFLMFTIAFTAVCVPLSALWFSWITVMSLAIGCIGGLLYLLLLSRSVAKLGPQSRQLGRAQLLVPVVLVLLSSRWDIFQLVPALIGFLIYKPAVILSTALDLRDGQSVAEASPKPSNA